MLILGEKENFKSKSKNCTANSDDNTSIDLNPCISLMYVVKNY